MPATRRSSVAKVWRARCMFSPCVIPRPTRPAAWRPLAPEVDDVPKVVDRDIDRFLVGKREAHPSQDSLAERQACAAVIRTSRPMVRHERVGLGGLWRGRRPVEELELATRIDRDRRLLRSHCHSRSLPDRPCQSLARNSPRARDLDTSERFLTQWSSRASFAVAASHNAGAELAIRPTERLPMAGETQMHLCLAVPSHLGCFRWRAC